MKKNDHRSIVSGDRVSNSSSSSACSIIEEDERSEPSSDEEAATLSHHCQEGGGRSQEEGDIRRDKGELIIMNRSRNEPLSRSSSTPKLERSLLARSNELIKEIAPSPSSMEYSYYVIASPMVGRRNISSNNSINTAPDMSNRSYSFVSMSSSKDSVSSSDVTATTVVQPSRKRAPKSRRLLQSVKEKLLAEIENINVELVKMDSEKLVLVNLRNSSLLYRNMICKSERNNQGIPNATKLRATCESIELKIQDEEHALQDDLSIPSIDEIRKDLKEILKVCNVITGNNNINTKSTSNNSTSKSIVGNNTKMSLVEELLCSVAKLYGVVDTVLVIFYENLNEENGVSGVGSDGIGDAATTDTVDSGIECKEDSSSLSTSPEPAVEERAVQGDTSKNINSPTTIDSILEKQNGSPDATTTSSLNKSVDQSTSSIPGKIERELKTLHRKLSKTTKLFAGIERLSSGNPKPKSLSLCFKEINASITLELTRELEYDEPWCQVIRRNVIDLQQHLLADRPGERELEHIRIIVGELIGRISIILKSNMLE